MSEGTCADCKFGRLHKQDRGSYDNPPGLAEMVECLRFPPQHEFNPCGNRKWKVFHGPITEVDYWCGEFQPRDARKARAE